MIKRMLAGAGIAVVLLFGAIPVSAQMPIPVGPGGKAEPSPIGGMAVLAALGGGYALKKLREKKHE
jgi:hypothetical protein